MTQAPHPAVAPTLAALAQLAAYQPTDAADLADVLRSLHAYAAPNVIDALSDVLDHLADHATRAVAHGQFDGEHAGQVAEHLARMSSHLSAGAWDHLDRARADTGHYHGSEQLRTIDRYVPVDHPGVDVPAALRPWATAWLDYHPVDITPPELRPEGLPASVAEGWAQPYPSPLDVPDWPARWAAALIPFEVDEWGWPLNPTGRSGRSGRNLGAWGENQAADPIVIASHGADRRVLLIRRSDIGAWAIPGGMVDPGESAPATLARELREETGIDLADLEPVILTRTYVKDWRATDHAWVCSTVALYQLPDAPAARAGDDADDAAWWPLPDLDTLSAALAPLGGLYPAHRPLLAAALDHLAGHAA
ncbi:MAG TPA: NUDIX domain-containing protein [Actinocrinis sp.]|uniref:NUDIX domain-containing protein n=1 Tax=Actinocrinis sp. TaxID=1920516 RepID=UPI002DDD0795|nr:NUDIX domain-containing protein [Actinocrinis sp.]HEV2343471.1 NUDIX domain-containing protein [Actinocrinis sp.]